MPTFDLTEFSHELEGELRGNILPFWMANTVDRVNGGFFGALTNDLKIHNEVPRSTILCSRILWTFSAAFRRYGQAEYLSMAKQAYDYLRQVFWDADYGGVFWSVDAEGTPVLDRKHHYAQAFAIYGLSEYYQAAKDPESLRLARELFHLLEKNAFEPEHGGYIEGRSRHWEALADMRLSERDMDCQKSMNTLLHILEAYTNLLRVWDDPELRKQHRALIQVFQDHIIDPQRGHLRLFFDHSWNSLLDHVSYGHDIEASWLLQEAAEMHDSLMLRAQMKEAAVRIAAGVLAEGVERDGSIPYERGPDGWLDGLISWWVQAEAVVGFYNAYQASEDEKFAEAAWRSWGFISKRLVDRTYGDWFKRLDPDGMPETGAFKVGPWECPYHHSRMCLEMLKRLGE